MDLEDEKKRLAYHLVGQIVGTLISFVIGYSTKCDPNSGYAFIMVLIFVITQCHNIYTIADCISRKKYGVDGFDNSKDEKEQLDRCIPVYAVLFILFATCHIAMAIYCVYFS